MARSVDDVGLKIERAPWRDFRRWFSRRFDPGNHVFVVGPTRSGKSVLLRELVAMKPKRNWLVMDAKGGDDPSLEMPGFDLIRSWPPSDGFPDLFDDERLLTKLRRTLGLEPDPAPPPPKPKHYRLAPAVTELSKVIDQRQTFAKAFDETFRLRGGQAYSLVIDEGQRIVAERRAGGMSLGESLVPFFNMKGYHGSSVVFATQWPNYVPPGSHAETRHRFVFKLPDHDRRVRAGEMLGERSQVPAVIASLERHEFLYQDAWYDRWAISKVQL